MPELSELSMSWEEEATDIHFSQRPLPSDSASPPILWAHSGMGPAEDSRVVTGYYIQGSDRARPVPSEAWRDTAPGSWHSWSTVLGWEQWPRRQDAPPPAEVTGPGLLRLFISHRWETPDQPDPQHAQLLSLKAGLSLALAAAVLLGDDEPAATQSGLPELFAAYLRDVDPTVVSTPALREWAAALKAAAEGASTEAELAPMAEKLEHTVPGVRAPLTRIRDRVLIWYDYASMFQAPRTPAEQEAFRHEIVELNRIQARAATVVIAGDDQYTSRAWCFLEMCAGMRHHIVELVPSWGTQVGMSPTTASRWASRTDQLIGALNSLGLDAIYGSGLAATHPEDMRDISRLMSELPLIGLVETDDSDLVGGVIPLPIREGQWITVRSADSFGPPDTVAPFPMEAPGDLPAPDLLTSAARRCAGSDGLASEIGIWVYTTQRTLSLAWAARAGEFWEVLRLHLEDVAARGRLRLPSLSGPTSVGCLWADARALADDGLGWTRIVPSKARVLVVFTQPDLPAICLILDRVVGSHLAAGVPVVTYSPDTGRTTVHTPTEGSELRAPRLTANVLATPRIRRTNAYPRQLLLNTQVTAENVGLYAALRLDPAGGPPAPGEVSDVVAAAGLGVAGAVITERDMLSSSTQRVRVEGLARSIAATWDQWFAPRVDASAWNVGMAPLQLDIIEQLVLSSAPPPTTRSSDAGSSRPWWTSTRDSPSPRGSSRSPRTWQRRSVSSHSHGSTQAEDRTNQILITCGAQRALRVRVHAMMETGTPALIEDHPCEEPARPRRSTPSWARVPFSDVPPHQLPAGAWRSRGDGSSPPSPPPAPSLRSLREHVAAAGVSYRSGSVG